MTNAFSNLETTVRAIVKEAGPTPDQTGLANSIVAAVKNTVGELEGQVSALATEADGLRSELQLAKNELLEFQTTPEAAPEESPNDGESSDNSSTSTEPSVGPAESTDDSNSTLTTSENDPTAIGNLSGTRVTGPTEGEANDLAGQPKPASVSKSTK